MLNIVASRAVALASTLKRGGIIVNEHTLTRGQLRQHVEALHSSFDFIGLDELPERLGRRAKKAFCLLTFDDGKRSNATELAPELERLGIPAVFFVVSGFLDGDGPLWFDRYELLHKKLGAFPSGLGLRVISQLPYRLLVERVARACAEHGIDVDPNDEDIAAMSWDQARDLHRRGFAIGAHGVTHAIMTRETRADALENIERSIADVGTQIGTLCKSFAFPNGNYTAELAQHALGCGVKTVMTTEPTWADASFPLWRLPRIQLFAEQERSRIELKIALGSVGHVLANPDGTGRAYRHVNRLSRLMAKNGTP